MDEPLTKGVALVGDPFAAGLPTTASAPDSFDRTKVRLILAAETLFAEQSIENVSLREIARAADNGNNYAVQYHFGGKDGLIQAIFAYRVWQMDEQRRVGLDKLLSLNGEPDLRALLELLFLPLLALTNDSGRHTYAGFVVKYLLLSRPTGLPHAMDSLTETTVALRQIVAAVEARLSHLPEDLVANRIMTASLMFNAMLVRSDNDGWSEKGGMRFRERVTDCLEMIAGALRAPVSPQE
jgi:AcrR family transcriptional regulator